MGHDPEIYSYRLKMEAAAAYYDFLKAHKADAADWFRDNCYLEAYNSPYDCTGQEFTNRYKLFRRRGHWFAYHSISRDV